MQLADRRCFQAKRKRDWKGERERRTHTESLRGVTNCAFVVQFIKQTKKKRPEKGDKMMMVNG